MGVPQLYDVYPARFNSMTLNQVGNQSFSPGIQALIAQAGGSVDPGLDAVAEVDSRWKFTSRDVQQVLTNVALATGLNVSSGAKMQFQRRKHAGIFESGSDHVHLTSSVGFLWIEEFGFEQSSKEGGDVSLQYAALFDGSTDPTVVSLSQALIGSPAVNAVHTLGPVVIEGAQLPGVKKWRCKTGIEVVLEPSDGEVASRIIAIQKRMQTIEIEVRNISILSSITAYKGSISSGITCYAQKVLAGGHHVNWGTGAHIAATVTQGTYTVEEISGSKGENANVKITVLATNNNISVNPAATISLP